MNFLFWGREERLRGETGFKVNGPRRVTGAMMERKKKMRLIKELLKSEKGEKRAEDGAIISLKIQDLKIKSARIQKHPAACDSLDMRWHGNPK